LEKALIFGANGQDGYYLNKLLRFNKIQVIPVSRTASSIIGNVADFEFVEGVVKEHRPKYVFHLAANSTTNHSSLFENHYSISSGTLNVLEAVRKHKPDAKVFISGSALQFKNDGYPISEDSPFNSSSAYSAERIYSVYLSRYFREKFNLNTYVGYLFNHDSPLRKENHVNQKIVMSAIRILNGSNEKLVLWDIYVKKEFNYAGDIVTAIWKLISQNEVSEMVIGSGKAYDILFWLEYCFGKVGLNWQEHTIINQNHISDYSILVSNPKNLFLTGWEPTKDIFQLADLMLKCGKKLTLNI